jgi:hypothetical protein
MLRKCSATVSPYSWLKTCFSDIPGKNPHSGVLAGFSGIGNDIRTGKGAHFGRIFPEYSIPSKHSFQKTYRISEESSTIDNYDIVHSDNYENCCNSLPDPELCRPDSLNNSFALTHPLHQKIRNNNYG